MATRRSILVIFLSILSAAGAAGRARPAFAGGPAAKTALPLTITFDSSRDASETRLALADVAHDFPRDWSGYEALVLEVRASSPQRINLRVFTRGGAAGAERSSRVLFHPYPGVWLRAAIPVSLLAQPPATGNDMAAVGNRSRVGYFLGLWGPFVPLTDVEAIGFEMEHPIGSPTLEVRALRLEKTSPGRRGARRLAARRRARAVRHNADVGREGCIRSRSCARRGGTRTARSRPATSASAATAASPSTTAKATGFFRVEKRGRPVVVRRPGRPPVPLAGRRRRSGRRWRHRPRGATRSSARGRRRASLPVARAGRRPRPLLLHLEPGAPLRRRLARRLDRPHGSAHGRVGPQHRRELERRAAVGREEKALRRPARELAHRRELPRPARRLLRGVREGGGRARAPAVRAAAGRPVAPRLLPRERAAVPAEGAADGRARPRRARHGDPRRAREVARCGGHRGAAEAVRRRRVRALRGDHERGGEAPRPRTTSNLGMRSGGSPTDAEIRAARAFDVYSVNVYDYEVPAARVREDRRAHRQAGPHRRVPLRHARPRPGGEPRPGARRRPSAGRRTATTSRTRSRCRRWWARTGSSGRTSRRRAASTARATTSASST